MTTLSLLVPTRGRPQQLRTLIESMEKTVSVPAAVELVLLVDDDDEAMRAEVFTASFHIRRVSAEPDLTMGEMNRRCFAASTGDWVMLANDDIIVKTPGWDQAIREQADASDGLILIHVNDGLFGFSLCTFPCVSRRLVGLIGSVCPAEYRRYRIDDHMFHIFGLMAYLGERRIIYLPEVVFDHQNRSETGAYRANPEILAKDGETFEHLLSARFAAATNLLTTVDPGWDREKLRRELLAAPHAFKLRRRRYLKVVGRDPSAPTFFARVVGVVGNQLRGVLSSEGVK